MKLRPQSLLVAALLALPSLAPAQDKASKLQVYILAGQSNMEGHAKVSTLPYLSTDPKTAALLGKMQSADGKPKVCEKVWISYLTGSKKGTGKLTAGFGSRRNPSEDGGKIGPEFTFGITVSEHSTGPILIIKTAWGGKSLHTDFRPPSAIPSKLSQQELDKLPKAKLDRAKLQARVDPKTGHYYRLMIEHVRHVLSDLKRVCPAYDPKVGYEVAGFVWFQGWNDMVDRRTYPQRNRPGGYDKYSDCMAHFIRDVRRELKQPKLPFVIGVMGVGGPIPAAAAKKRVVHANFRAAMAAPASLPEFRGNVVAVPTAPFWDQKLSAITDKVGKAKNIARLLRKKHRDHPNRDGSMSPAEQAACVASIAASSSARPRKPRSSSAPPTRATITWAAARTMAQIGVAFADAFRKMKR